MSNGTNNSSRGGGGGGGGANTPTPATPNQATPTPAANTPSGVTYDQFMQMTDAQKLQTMVDIITDPSIRTPAHIDNSQTSRVMYALGMDNKPTVVADSQLDNMPGREIYRTVYEQGSMPPPSTGDVLDQIRTGDYTCMSGPGGSAHSRAIYFATDFGDSAIYGSGEKNPQMMRAKINPTANIRSENSLTRQMQGDTTWNSNRFLSNSFSMTDKLSLYALSHGVDGWYSGTYTMMVNRGALTASSQNKSIYRSGRSVASSWATAPNK